MSLGHSSSSTNPGTATWNESVFPNTSNVANAFTQPSAYSTTPAQNWGGNHGVFGTTSIQQLPSWGQNNTSASNGSWTQQSTLGNPFQSSVFPPTSSLISGGQQSSSPPPLIPPRAGPVKEPPKVDTDAFVDLDPLGEKEKKDIKEMFKDFQMVKPPSTLAKNGKKADLPVSCLQFAMNWHMNRHHCWQAVLIDIVFLQNHWKLVARTSLIVLLDQVYLEDQ